MIDLHAHLLPGVDDGPATFESSIRLARAALAAGTTTMVATPHIDRQFAVEPKDVAWVLEDLRSALRHADVPLEVLVGGEVAPDRVGDLDDESLRAVRLGGGPYVLLECPLSSNLGPLEAVIATLRDRGFEILLAHPERAPALQRDLPRLRALVDDGALCSVTAGAFTGQFGRPARSLAQTMLKEGLVHTIDSDTHDAARRPPDLGGGLAAAGIEDTPLATWLTEDAPAAILAGELLPERPELPRTRRRAGLFRRAS
jgi:protein-tyrosine phosphatase